MSARPSLAGSSEEGSCRAARSYRTPRGPSGPQISRCPPSRSTYGAYMPVEALRELQIPNN